MTDSNLMARLAAQPGPVIVEVWAPWCGPCRAMAPALEKVAGEFEGRVPLWRINADEDAASVQVLRVMGIPTMIVYRDGVEVNRRSGQANYAELTALFTWAMANEPTAPPPGMSGQVRLLRMVSALAVLILAIAASQPWLIVVAAIIFFSAVHDRCPLWQAVQRMWRPAAVAPAASV